MILVCRIDDDGVVVDMFVLFPQRLERFAAILADHHHRIERIDSVRIVRAADNFVVVLGAARDIAAHLLPGFTSVGTEEKTTLAFSRFDDRINNLRIHRRDVQADFPLVDIRQATLNLSPSHPTVGGLVKRRLRTAVDQHPFMPPPLIGTRVKNIGIARIDVDFVDPRHRADFQYVFPGLSPIGRPEQPPITAVLPQGALRGYEDDVWILRMNRDHSDVFAVFQTHPLKRSTAIGRFVEPIPIADTALGVVLSCSNPNGMPIVGTDRDTTDRVRTLRIKNRPECHAGIFCLPDSARGSYDVPNGPIDRIDCDVAHTARHERRSNTTKFHRGNKPRVHPGCFIFGFVGVLTKCE